jgi:hypothetical protein
VMSLYRFYGDSNTVHCSDCSTTVHCDRDRFATIDSFDRCEFRKKNREQSQTLFLLCRVVSGVLLSRIENLSYVLAWTKKNTGNKIGDPFWVDIVELPRLKMVSCCVFFKFMRSPSPSVLFCTMCNEKVCETFKCFKHLLKRFKALSNILNILKTFQVLFERFKVMF